MRAKIYQGHLDRRLNRLYPSGHGILEHLPRRKNTGRKPRSLGAEQQLCDVVPCKPGGLAAPSHPLPRSSVSMVLATNGTPAQGNLSAELARGVWGALGKSNQSQSVEGTQVLGQSSGWGGFGNSL